MSHAVSKEMVVAVSLKSFYELVIDYERYPEFVPGVKACRVRKVGKEKHVEYEVDLGIRKIRYTLRHAEEPPRRVSWSLVGGEMMKVSNGSWVLSDADGRTRAVYTVEVQIAKPPLLPQGIVDRITDELTRVQLPKTLEAFKLRAEGG
jgi:ribosome-associated toxin RatA of RatAB toxin-antitoxin module